MPVYVSRHARLVVGDVTFHPGACRAEDADACAAAAAAHYNEPAAGLVFGVSYDERLADAPGVGVDFVSVETQEDRDAAAEAAKKTTKPSSK